VSEALKAGLLAVNLAGVDLASRSGSGEAAQASLLRLLVPALVEVAAPPGQPVPLLADMAVKLLTHLAASPAAPAFRVAAAELPTAAKQRLQSALAAAAQQAAAAAQQQQQADAQPAATGPMQRATVKLNFAPFRK
jgi:hypothetical protein